MDAGCFLDGRVGFLDVPRWARPGIYFAVTVPLPFLDSPEALQILRGYRLRTLAHFAIALALIGAGGLSGHGVLLFLGSIWFVGGPLAAFWGAHKQAMRYSVQGNRIRQAVLEQRVANPPGGWAGQLVPFAILIAISAYLQLRWNQIPRRFPVHWGIDGRPNGWSTNTAMGVYAPIAIGILILAGIAVTAYGIRHLARGMHTSGSGTVAHDFAQRTGIFLLIVEYFLAVTFSLVALLPLTGSRGVMSLLIMVLLIVPILVMLILWLNKGRPHVEGHPAVIAGATGGDGTPDECWKFGMFYFNPDDAAVFVEKRFGVGYTLNFAHPSAWICMALVLILPIILLFFLSHQS